MKKIRLLGTLAFLGTHYQGWQTQKQGRSIQEKVEAVFQQILQQPIHVYGASRTDAGVHARGFVFHVDVVTNMTPSKLRHHVNRLLDEAIFLVKLKRVPSTFEARYQHTKKTYTYAVLCGERNPFLKETTTYVPYHLDQAKLTPAISLFVGQHNFRYFTTKKEDGGHFIRTIFSLTLKQKKNVFIFTFVGDGFMTYMIRMIVGTLLAYQQDKLTLSDLKGFLSGEKQGPVSYKAPAHGLCLEKVQYES
jgi:tRNA pseudouridine38-40 synthase